MLITTNKTMENDLNDLNDLKDFKNSNLIFLVGLTQRSSRWPGSSRTRRRHSPG